MPIIVWGEITHPFLNFNCYAVKGRELLSDFTIETMLGKMGPCWLVDKPKFAPLDPI